MPSGSMSMDKSKGILAGRRHPGGGPGRAVFAAVLLTLATWASALRAEPPGNAEEAGVVLVLAQTGPQSGGTGTGFVVAPGRVVTNAHVILPDAIRFAVILPDSNRQIEARPIWVDRQADLALIEVTGLSAAPLRISVAPPRRGDQVHAIGYPGSSLNFQARNDRIVSTTASGRVTALYSTSFANNGPAYPSIQHDAAIGQGNSGGPLFDDCGRVIGINTLGPGVDPATGRVIPDQTFIASTMPQLRTLLGGSGQNIRLNISDERCEPSRGGTPPPPPTANKAQPQTPASSNPLAEIPLWVLVAIGLAAVALIGTGLVLVAKRRAGQSRPGPTPGVPPQRDEEPGWQLVPVDGGSPLALDRKRLSTRFGLVLGRNQHFSDLVIRSEAVSRRHCRLATVNGQLFIEDLSSAEGTTVGFSSLVAFKPQPIGAGDTIRLVDRSFRIEPYWGAGPSAQSRFSTFLIGRLAACDLRLGDSSVSRRHAELVVADNGAALLSDRDSTQGTFVRRGAGWSRVTHVEITAGMTVRFGDVEIAADRLLGLARARPAPAGSRQPQAIRRNPSDGSVTDAD
jgi:S1-C subfamily serine protease/pSer/pThr/pTyr-binding forkhead associated (FHA) protein